MTRTLIVPIYNWYWDVTLQMSELRQKLNQDKWQQVYNIKKASAKHDICIYMLHMN